MRQPSCIMSGWDGKLFSVKSSERFVFRSDEKCRQNIEVLEGRRTREKVFVPLTLKVYSYTGWLWDEGHRRLNAESKNVKLKGCHCVRGKC